MRAYGYNDGKIVPDEARIIRELATRVSLGETLWSITADLHRRGVPTAQGGKWASATVRALLRNPRIAGYPTGVRETRYPPIVAEDMWKKVCELLSDPTRLAPRQSQRPRHLLSGGFLSCALCGTAMKPKSIPSAGTWAYECDTRPPAVGCGRLRIAALGVEMEVSANVLARIALPDTRLTILRALELKANGPTRVRTLADAVTDATISGDNQETIDNLVLQYDLVKTELELVADIADHFRDIVNLKPAALARWWEAALVEQRRAILDFLITTVKVKPASKLGRWPGGGINPDRLEFVWR